jgi:hypothetical protein
MPVLGNQTEGSVIDASWEKEKSFSTEPNWETGKGILSNTIGNSTERTVITEHGWETGTTDCCY